MIAMPLPTSIWRYAINSGKLVGKITPCGETLIVEFLPNRKRFIRSSITENTFKCRDTISANLHPSALPFSIKREHLDEEKILLPGTRNVSLSPHLPKQF